MKSAKRKKNIAKSLILLFTAFCLLVSCAGCSRFSFLPKKGEDSGAPTDTDKEGDLPAGAPADPTPTTVYYNRYTGLACDEAILSCRPISVCIGNFDGKRQEGLSFADILIESPYDGDKTSIFALYTDHTRATAICGVSSIRNYMLPSVNAFDSIAAYAGNGDKKTGEAHIQNGDYLDCLYHNLSSAFEESTEGIFTTNVKALTDAATAKGYSLTIGDKTLPYRHAALDTIFTPTGNRIRNISFRYSMANTVSFSYDDKARIYQREQNGEPHIDAQTQEQLSFSNVLLLFHNVSYYHSSNSTTFTLDTEKGGDGYLYTGGGVVPVKWSYQSDGTLSVLDETGEKITVNRGKTYIGMLRVTDSSTLIAK